MTDTGEHEPNIEAWFWELIKQTRPDEDALRAALERMDRESLEKFVVFFHIASDYTRDAWDGPYIQVIGDALSEDSTSDLNDWVVAQGFDAWMYARSLDAG